MTTQTFEDFFACALGDKGGKGGPHPYQADLASNDRLPELMAVPTGCGKTAAVVLGWSWRRRRHPSEDVRKHTPRRLIYCLPMRTLVEQVHQNIVDWFTNLGWIQPPQADSSTYRPSWSTDDVPVFRLMGGEEATEWEAYPEREAVLVGTQDMLLSRALNRGYAMKPQAWPIAFGLVNVDAMWVLDEVQLMGVGRTTSVQLQQFRRSPKDLPRHSLWMSATLGTRSPDGFRQRWTQPGPLWMHTPEHGDRDVEVLGLGTKDRKRLSRVLEATKRVEGALGANEDKELAQRLLCYASDGRLVLVMVNRVSRAQELFQRVDAIRRKETPYPDVVLLHSRFRPRDRTVALTRLYTEVPDRGRIVVSTQVLEAGVDLDADVLVTEICPWPSLVQRLGRLNRRGKKEGIFEVLDVPFEEPEGGWPTTKSERAKAQEAAQSNAALPYSWFDLEAARKRLDRLDGHASILAIEKVERDAPYTVRVEGHVLRRHHLDDLFDTDPDLSGGHLDVSRFVRSTRTDLDVAVLWRQLEGTEPEQSPAPHPDEICKVSIAALRGLGADKRGWLLGLQRCRRRCGAWLEVGLGDRGIRPGDTVMLDLSTGGYDDRLGWVGSEDSRPSSWVSGVDGHRSWVRADSPTAEAVDDRTDSWASREADPRSHARRWMRLSEHLCTAESEAHRLGEALVPGLAAQLAIAARWHDVGKALERTDTDAAFQPFQEMLRKAGHSEPPDPIHDVEYAKSNGRGYPWRRHHSFRHEVASALAYLAGEDPEDVVAWLIMAHHGKVRMLPTPWNDLTMDDAAGVRPNDRLPGRTVSLVAHDGECLLSPGLLQPSRSHPGWQGRAVALIAEHGPQFLAYLEALLRVADWRASR